MREIKTAAVSCERLTNQMVSTMADAKRMMRFVMTDPPRIYPDDGSSPVEAPDHSYLVPVTNATVAFSEVADELLTRHPQARFAAYYLDRADGLRQWGMRSREDFDCSVIAKAFGGGGHKQASGFTQKIPWSY